MPDGIAKGIGSELGSLGKQIVREVAQVPAKITGMDAGTNEATGLGTGGKKQKGQKGQTRSSSQNIAPGEQIDSLTAIRQKDEVEKQKQLAQARQLLQQFIRPDEQKEPTLREKQEMEELEKKKKEIEEEKEKAKKLLQPTAAKRPRGDLYGVKAKQFGGEKGKNIKAQ